MSARAAARTLTGEPPRAIEVVVGTRPDGSPGATIKPDKYRATDVPLTDPDMVRALIDDLQEVLAHLEGRTYEVCAWCPRPGTTVRASNDMLDYPSCGEPGHGLNLRGSLQ